MRRSCTRDETLKGNLRTPPVYPSAARGASTTLAHAKKNRPHPSLIEYHFYFDGHDFGWGGAVSGDVDTAVSLMHRLRTLGIRAHFWI